MKFLVVFKWQTDPHDKISEDPLWKIVDLPCLPPVGSTLWFNSNGGHLDGSVVTAIQWWENWPDWYEVHLDVAHVDQAKDGEFVEWMKELGWHHEATEPMSDFLSSL